MNDADDDAIIGVFNFGPTTAYGRVLAVRAVVSELVRRVLVIVKFRGLYGLKQVRGYLWSLLQKLKAWLNPKDPNVLLGGAILVAYLMRRARLRGVQAQVLATKQKFYKNMIASATTYEEWMHGAKMLEQFILRRRDADLYDEELVQSRLFELHRRRQEGCLDDMVFCLRTDLIRNLGNMCNPELHKNRLHTPKLIQDYIDEVRTHLRTICDAPESPEFSLDDKLAFFQETRHAFGRTALLLSGGAAMGAFHLGVCKTLIKHELLPRVVAGASVGSIICSFCATRTWPALQAFFDDHMPQMLFFEEMGNFFNLMHRLVTRGAVQEIGQLQRKMRELIGDLTFQEAYDISGRVLGISVCSPRPHEPPRLLNYLTSPNVVIWSAVTASCAFPGLFEAQELMAKDRFGRLIPYHHSTQLGPNQQGEKLSFQAARRAWRDGSLESDLPMTQLKELFGVNHFVVSQANPHIAPLLRLKESVRCYGGHLASKAMHLLEMEIKHRCNQALEMGFRLGGLAKLFAQEWEGDITIVMNATWQQYVKLITNPTNTELKRGIGQGVRACWAKLSAVNANSSIELMLDLCVSELNRRKHELRRMAREQCEPGCSGENCGGQLRPQGGRGLGRGRIPSWITMHRDGSFECLDEEGVELANKTNPWAGPLSRRSRKAIDRHGSSDSDAENEPINQLSWTKAGGPLFRLPSHEFGNPGG